MKEKIFEKVVKWKKEFEGKKIIEGIIPLITIISYELVRSGMDGWIMLLIIIMIWSLNKIVDGWRCGKRIYWREVK